MAQFVFETATARVAPHMHFCCPALRRLTQSLLPALALALASPLWAQSPIPGSNDGPTSPSGPIRLRQPQQATPSATAPQGQAVQRPVTSQRTLPADRSGDDRIDGLDDELERQPRYKPGEFERYIQKLVRDPSLRRFGADLVIDASTDRSNPLPEPDPTLPTDFRVSPGDELVINIWGSVDADLRLTVDRSGRINIPRVGSITVVGMTTPEVGAAIDKQARKIFKNFEVNVSLGQLRSIRLFVTGFAQRPGAYTASSLATMSSILFNRAGGPSASGSFRDIELRRAGRTVAKLDLYDLMLFGRRDADQSVQADDVIHIGPVGRQVALIGSVNKPAIFELRESETVADLLRMGGGLNSVADSTRVAVERVSERNDNRVRQLNLPVDNGTPLAAGDVVRAFSAIDAVQPLARQNNRVRIEGEVQRPGTYILPPQSTIGDAVRAAGGLTPSAFLFGTEFNRESVRSTQQLNFERALRDIEIDVSRRSGANAARTADDAAAQAQQQISSDRLLTRLRDARPTGRVVLQLPVDAKQLPDLALEDGDRLLIPSMPTTVGVFGSVFNAGSYLFSESRKVDDYLRLAGSATANADKDSIFVVRANGSVVSAQQGKGWFGVTATRIEDALALPGDTVFVPLEVNKTTFLQSAKDWTQVLSQFGLGLASIKFVLP
jgi:protein involved in polysaccharide export with SLBB domain